MNPQAVRTIGDLLSDRRGEVLRHLSGTDVSEQRFVDEIRRKIPELADHGLPDFEKVCLLRDWVARTIPGSVSVKDTLDTKPDFFFYTCDAPTLFGAFSQGLGGLYCGGASYALAKLYHSFGFETFIYNGGIRSSVASHCVTLVKIKFDGISLLSVQDAFFNITFLTTHGKPLDFFQLLFLLQARQHDEVTLKFDPLGFSRDFHDGATAFRKQFSLPIFLEESAPPYLQALEQHGFPSDLVYLLANPIGCWAPAQATARRLRSQIAKTLRCDPRDIDLNYGTE